MLRLSLLLLATLIAPHSNLLAQQSEFAPQRNLNSYFPLEVPPSAQAWLSRKQKLKDHLLTSLGLNPLPEKTDLNAKVFGRQDLGEYTVEKVYFESMPGFYVTGSLYRPKNAKGKSPGVLSPHGHHRDGRFRNASPQEVEAELKSGAETFETNARSPLQARCVHLAKMGCVVFHYDMVGYADSQQIPMSIAHGFSQPRDELNQPERYGFFSPQAELRMQSIMGLQTWNSIRSLDFLESLTDVDPDRIGVTGASGGGTQTFILCAIDDRPDVSFPAVMVSTAMQGGCTCENCSLIRSQSGNVEFAAMFAPKPMGLTAADDWTREMETKGFPELQKLYALLGEPDQVELTARLEFGHNYNQVSREAMYRLFDKHLGLNGNTQESSIRFLTPKQMTVWDDSTRPTLTGVELESQLLSHWHQSRLKSVVNQLNLSDSPSRFFQERIGDLTGVRLNPPQVTIKSTESATNEHTNTTSYSGVDADGEQLRWNITQLADAKGGHQVFLIGKNPKLREALISAGHAVVEVQSLQDKSKNGLVNNGRKAAGYTFGYNPPLIVARARQWIAILELQRQNDEPKPILIGSGNQTGLAMIVASQTGKHLKGAAFGNWNAFSFGDSAELESENFFPGGMAYFGMQAYRVALDELPVLAGGQQPDLSPPVAQLLRLRGAKPELDSGSVSQWQFTPADQFSQQLMDWLGQLL